MDSLHGTQNILIQDISDSTITVNVNGEVREVLRELHAVRALLEELKAETLQSGGKVYHIGSITNATFEYVVQQVRQADGLPQGLSENLMTGRPVWVNSLKQALLKQQVAVGNQPFAIFQHYGWLIETFLQKMGTDVGQQATPRALSFMTEAFQASLRYLAYIQLAQILAAPDRPRLPWLEDFLAAAPENHPSVDCIPLLLLSTEYIGETGGFVPEMRPLVQELSRPGSDLSGITRFLDQHRIRLLNHQLPENEHLSILLDEYRTALIEWLRRLAFLAKYRLVSIKDINLNYRLGTRKWFAHLYGELHGVYEAVAAGEDYLLYEVQDAFTYNHSVLLFRGTDIARCLEHLHEGANYLSLSPLVVDASVYAAKPTQTPEVFYYTGKIARQYHFAQYKNELPVGEKATLDSNKSLIVKPQNNDQPRLDDLFGHITAIFHP